MGFGTQRGFFESCWWKWHSSALETSAAVQPKATSTTNIGAAILEPQEFDYNVAEKLGVVLAAV